MKIIRNFLERATLGRASGFYAAILMAALFSLSACGSDDVAAVQSCVFQSDCELGFACSTASNECIQLPCVNGVCVEDPNLVCVVTPAHPGGTCSSPECTGDAQCDVSAGETCQAGVCATGGTTGGCVNNSDCPDGQICNVADQCVPGEDVVEPEDCDNACVDGQTCNTTTGECEGGTSDPCGGSCVAGQTCNAATGVCETDDINNPPCGGSCPSGQSCNTATNACEADTQTDPCNGTCTASEICNNGTCVPNNCPPGSQTPETCAQDPVYNLFDAEGCYCSECLGDSDCNAAAGETCTENGECMACTESCDASQGADACSQDGFFCISGCCIECTGNSDCSVAGEVCVDGTCAPPPSCASDPTVCRAGTVCENDVCTTPSTDAGCTSAAECFPKTCNLQTNTCEDGAGSRLPDMCAADSDCPNSQVCAGGFFCMDGCFANCLFCIAGVYCMF